MAISSKPPGSDAEHEEVPHSVAQQRGSRATTPDPSAVLNVVRDSGGSARIWTIGLRSRRRSEVGHRATSLSLAQQSSPDGWHQTKATLAFQVLFNTETSKLVFSRPLRPEYWLTVSPSSEWRERILGAVPDLGRNTEHAHQFRVS